MYLFLILVFGLGLLVSSKIEVDALDFDGVSYKAKAKNIGSTPNFVSSGICFDSIEFDIVGPENPRNILNSYIDHYENLILNHRIASSLKKSPLFINLKYTDNITEKTLETNEGYSMDILKNVVSISSANVFGVLYGIQAFSEKVLFDFSKECYNIVNSKETGFIERQSPDSRHRELLLDSGRHFIPVPVLEQMLYSMAYARLNVLHWHIGDRQSFPLCLKSLTEDCSTSFSSQERYTVGDAKYIVEKAKSLGIRVIPEIDTPGHATPLCAAFNLCSGRGKCEYVFDVSNEETFQRITKIFEEIATIFPDRYIHTGADEVNFTCWDRNPRISKWMKSKGYSSKDAYGYFVTRVHKIIFDLGRIPISWDETYSHFGSASQYRKSSFVLDKRVAIQIWRRQITGSQVLKDGHPLVFTQSWPKGWYLDHISKDWKTMYYMNPFRSITSRLKKNLLGGGAEMWGETVDGSVIFNTVWPRAAAVAKYLWDGDIVDSKYVVEAKMKRFRCLLLSRGIGAAPITNEKARSAPEGPGSCEV